MHRNCPQLHLESELMRQGHREPLLLYFSNIIQMPKLLSVVIVSRDYWWEIISKVPGHLKKISLRLIKLHFIEKLTVPLELLYIPRMY